MMRKALIAGVILSLAAAGSVAAKERRSPPGKIIGQQQANKIIGNGQRQANKIIGNGKQASKIIGNGSTAENRKRDSLKSAGVITGNR